MSLRGNNAFTLIELLVVIAVIAMLLAILMPSFSKARSVAKRIKCQSNLKQIALAMEMYAQSHHDRYPCAMDPISTDPFYWLWMGRGWRGMMEPYFSTKIDANNPTVLLCPADKSTDYESTSYSYSMSFYHNPEQIDTMNNTAATYSNPQPSIPQKCSSVKHPSGKIMIGEWTSNHQRIEGKDNGWWCWEGRRNYLLADNSIVFLEAKNIRKARDGWPDANLTIHGIWGVDIVP